MPAVRDIHLDTEFIEDFQDAPAKVKKAINKLIRMISVSGQFPNSMETHKLENMDMWSGYVTVVNQHWRMLIIFNEDQTITFHRLMPHTDYTRYLRSLAR